MENLAILIACSILIVFTIVASVDGLYFHLWRYRLFERPSSRYEHLLHTWNAGFFPLTIACLFLVNAGGMLLYLGILLTLVTLVIEFLDVYEEKKSRLTLGGLTSTEYAMHFGMAGLRLFYTGLLLGAKPFSAWSITSPWVVSGPWPLFAIVLGASVVVTGAAIFILHVFLYYRTKG